MNLSDFAKTFFSSLMFLFVALIFPEMQNTALDANITNTGLDNAVTWFPTILLVICAVLPFAFALEESKK